MEGTNQNLSKILIKVLDDAGNSKWVHLCYIPEVLYEQYKTLRAQDIADLNQTIVRWVKADFDQDIQLFTITDLDQVKSLVKNHYKNTYPDVYLEQSTDRQGWLRVRITRNMRKDLGIDGE